MVGRCPNGRCSGECHNQSFLRTCLLSVIDNMLAVYVYVYAYVKLILCSAIFTARLATYSESSARIIRDAMFYMVWYHLLPENVRTLCHFHSNL